MSENENDFEALRRLLALKRHEIPPPGYFEDFSSRVIGRIRAGEAARELPWLLRLLQAFEAKPAYPVALASALCTLLLFGIVSVEQSPVLASSSIYPSNSPDFSFVPHAQDGPLVALTSSNSPAADVDLFGTGTPVTPSYYQPVSFDAN
ncbi:MAG TPA: hypothetical protein VMF08_20325 [Candidatus Sulfotelmatobacter sp.]|nr:hypothetical protein [Candidatus Sulfotelmatobacter sp.]